MEEGGSDGGREGEHWCSLTWAHHHPCPIMGAGRRSHAVVLWAAIVVGGHSFLFMGIHFHPWLFVFVGGHSFLFMGIRFHPWLFVFVGGHLLSLVGIRIRWWAFAFADTHNLFILQCHGVNEEENRCSFIRQASKSPVCHPPLLHSSRLLALLSSLPLLRFLPQQENAAFLAVDKHILQMTARIAYATSIASRRWVDVHPRNTSQLLPWLLLVCLLL